MITAELIVEQCSKHAVMGLLRTTRKVIYERDHVRLPQTVANSYSYTQQIRINAICPAIVDTQMTVSIIDTFKETNQAINTPEDVAKYIVGLEVAPEMNGKAIYGTLNLQRA